MKKFVLGLVLGILLSLSSVAVASNKLEVIKQSINFVVNGKTISMGQEYAAFNYDGHLYMPIRFFAESIGASIGYNAASETVSVLFSTNRIVIKDPLFPSISVGNLVLNQKGGETSIQGQLLVDENLETQKNPRYCFFTLHFYNQSGMEIGQADYGVLLDRPNQMGGIHPFQTRGNGDLTHYARIELKVGYFDETPIKGSLPPVPYIKSNANLSPLLSSYCWIGCADYPGPVRRVENQKPVQVLPGDSVTVEFDYTPKPAAVTVTRYRIENGQQVETAREPLIDNVFSFPSEEGVYVYQIFAQWKISEKYVSGDASYVFIVQVER
ncbi:stalk domain-containing protein [Paenibacillus hodogayensis]|uniref:Stalk domain-containing protein n=1 Tax=Paenibacillus hodogayensis TaxID=279208 RepID=A0ABV5W7Z1_9BACL